MPVCVHVCYQCIINLLTTAIFKYATSESYTTDVAQTYIHYVFVFFQKIHKKYSMNPVQFDTLQQIVEFEIKARQCRDSCSATIALLWLKR